MTLNCCCQLHLWHAVIFAGKAARMPRFVFLTNKFDELRVTLPSHTCHPIPQCLVCLVSMCIRTSNVVLPNIFFLPGQMTGPSGVHTPAPGRSAAATAHQTEGTRP
jgi:hypothetical protein